VIGWILIGGAVPTALVVYWIFLNDQADFNDSIRSWRRNDEEPLIDGGDRFLAVLLGLLCAVGWPLVWIFGLLYLIFSKVTIFTPIAEKERLARLAAKEQTAELEQLRRQVQEYKIKGGESL
jgi:type IV secretory pathway TrbD component